MNTTLDYLRSNRKWLVKDYAVWGGEGNFQSDLMLTESGSPDNRVVFHHEFSGGLSQLINFSDLFDHRGNQLPQKLNNAEIILIPRSPVSCFVLGPVGPSSFRLAKAADQPGNAIVDILIMEMN